MARRASSGGRSSGPRRAREHMTSTIHGRDQIDYVKVGAKRDGTITGLECTAICGPRRVLHAADAVHPVVHRLRDQRLLQDPEPPVHGQGRLHQQDGHRRHPRRRPARGHAPDRGDGRPARGRARAWTRSSCGARTSSRRRTSRPRWRSASSTTPATTTARSTSCSRTSTSTRSAASRRSCASQGMYRGIGFSTYMEICGLAPSRVVGPSGVGLQARLLGVRDRARARRRAR